MIVTITETYRKVTHWHFEGRDCLNSDLPTHEEIKDHPEWTKLPVEQSIFHDNGVGNPELKYIHDDGRESVYCGDSFDLITDERYRGTYNYINHAPVPEDLTDVTAVADCFVKGVGHTLVDVVPYFVGGNVRGKN